MSMYSLEQVAIRHGTGILEGGSAYQALKIVYDHLLDKMNKEADRGATKALVTKSPITFLEQAGGTMKISVLESSQAQLGDIAERLPSVSKANRCG